VLPLRRFLDQLQTSYHRTELLSSDPLEFVYHFDDPWDREAVGLIAAVLAYGNVKQIRKSIQEALSRIHSVSSSPQEFVRGLSKPKFRHRALHLFERYVHRFNSGSDLVALLVLLNGSWLKHGSLGSHLLTFLQPEDSHFGHALTLLFEDWETYDLQVTPSDRFAFLLTSPKNGSCCKRWCMYLRWMVRNDGVDPGVWTRPSQLTITFPKNRKFRTDQLIMPLDTHTGRITQYLGLASRKAIDWKTALEVTENLKLLDPDDPTRYDFALSRLGILDICQRVYREEICKKCQLLPACQFAHEHSRQHLRSTPSPRLSQWRP